MECPLFHRTSHTTFPKIISEAVGMPSPDFTTNLQRRSGASPSNATTSPVRRWAAKYVYNVHQAHDAWWHWLKDFEPKATHISFNETLGIVNHYRVPYQDTQAKTFDDKLAADAHLLEQAIERRFGQKLPALLKRFSESVPAPRPAR